MADRQSRRSWPAIVACLIGAGAAVHADVRPLTLYQKVARAALVARVRATSDSTRRPTMEVLQIYKGFYPGRSLTVVPFFQDYASPKPWLHREVFKKGEESVLFLSPFEADRDTAFNDPDTGKDEDEEASGRLFTLLNADQGKIDLPSEGESALTDTVKRIVEILAMGQSDLQSEALRALLRDRNPYLVEAGLEEVARYELAREEDVSSLLTLLTSNRDDFRAGALRILGQVGAAVRAAGGDLRDRPEIFTRVVDRAYQDSSAGVRSEAVRTLSWIRGEGVAAVLDAVRTRDADQKVRYEAGVALLRLSESHAP